CEGAPLPGGGEVGAVRARGGGASAYGESQNPHPLASLATSRRWGEVDSWQRRASLVGHMRLPRLPRGRRVAPRRTYLANGVENPATSLTRSACRVAPVLSNRRVRWVRTVESAMPSASATSGTPPISVMASRTRSSVGVSWYVFAITSGRFGISNVALRTNKATEASVTVPKLLRPPDVSGRAWAT